MSTTAEPAEDARAAALSRSLDALVGDDRDEGDAPAIPALGSFVQEPAENYRPDTPFRSGHVIGVSAEEGTGEPLVEALDTIQTWEPVQAVTHTLRLADIDHRLTRPARETSGPFAAHVDRALTNAAVAHGALGRARKPSAKAHWRREWLRWFGLVVRLVEIEEETS